MANKVVLTYDSIALDPAPTISVAKEFIYANDTIIGYKYIITLNGYGSSVSKRYNNTVSNISNTAVVLQDIKSILMRNGKNLHVGCGNETMLSAYGGILRSFNIAESPNQYTQYSQYTAVIDFNEAVFTNQFNTEISADSVASQDLVLNEQLKHLLSYNDNWNFTVGEEDMYRYYNRITPEGLANLEDYTTINVSYTITANGKHTFDINGNTIPAWQKAKEFVQKKMYDQILIFRTRGPLAAGLFNTQFYDSNDINDTNTLNTSHSSLFSATPAIFPILDSSIVQNYRIFDEYISCNTAEGDGTFTATYNCVLKFVNNFSEILWPQKSIHSFTVNYEQIRDFTTAERVITVNGTLEGMLETNILNNIPTGQVFFLPNNGKFIGESNRSLSSKYTNALNDFIQYIGNRPSYNFNYYGSDDLSPNFKAVLSINYATLFPDTLPTDILDCEEGQVQLSSILALPQSFSVDHDYNGSVSYSASYSTSRSCAMERGFETLSVTESDSVPQYVEFIIPGRANGPILQSLNTHNQKRLTLNFQGSTKKGCLKGTPFSDTDLDDFPILNGSGVCETDQYVNLPPAVLCILQDTEDAHPELIPESYKYDYNPIDGSFTLNKTYIICRTEPVVCFP